jgi:hypothetical protein
MRIHNLCVIPAYSRQTCLTTIDLYNIDSAIHRVVCQKYDVLDNSDIQNSQKLDPLAKTVKKFNPKIS